MNGCPYEAMKNYLYNTQKKVNKLKKKLKEKVAKFLLKKKNSKKFF
jgi:hypothetical protein